MLKKTVVLIALLGVVGVLPLLAEDHQGLDKFTFSMGGGISTPLNPTAQYAGVSSNFLLGTGYKINKRNSISGEFMVSGLPGDVFVLQPINVPTVRSNLYSLGATYRYQMDRIGGSVFGVYVLGGGGWYDRYITLDQNYVIPANTPCQPYYSWWGYGCSGGYVTTATIAKKGVSAGGVNAGIGFTISLAHGMSFFTEARYVYAWTPTVPSTLIPVTMGFRFN